MVSRFGIELEVLEKALQNMINEGYMGKDDTIEDLEDRAYSCCEGLAWYAVNKIHQWAN
jgi:hypothetical protein